MSYSQIDGDGAANTISSAISLATSGRYLSIMNTANTAIDLQMVISTAGDAAWIHPDSIASLDPEVHTSHTGRIAISDLSAAGDQKVLDVIGLEAYSGIIIPFDNDSASTVPVSGVTITTPHGTSSARGDRVYFGIVEA